jgi:Zn-finger nucleic acid-binding protein
MNCPSCGAPMRLESGKECLTCDYCRNVFFPERNDDGVRVLGEPAAESCPVCGVPLMHASVSGQRLRYCNHCRGMLIGMDVFVVLVQELRARFDAAGVVPEAPNPRDLQRKLDCPQCHRRMDTHFYGGPGNIVIDDCSPCRLNWLDHGELDRIIHAPDRIYGDGGWVNTEDPL